MQTLPISESSGPLNRPPQPEHNGQGQGNARGADDFVGQPFSPQGLLERMRVTLVRTGKLRAESEGS